LTGNQMIVWGESKRNRAALLRLGSTHVAPVAVADSYQAKLWGVTVSNKLGVLANDTDGMATC
jgi:hypothetical protein